MEEPKRYQVSGWVCLTAKPKESDGVEYHIGEFASLRDAEMVRRERLKVGWGRIEVKDLMTGQVLPIVHWACLL